MPNCLPVLVAGGQGTRMGVPGGKLFLPLAGLPLLVHPARALLARFPGVLLTVLGEMDRPRFLTALAEDRQRVVFADPGATRNLSVRSALDRADGLGLPGDLVLIHDAARPLLHASLIDRLLSALTAEMDGVIPVLPVSDTILQLDERGRAAGYPDRSRLRRVQTPQLFRRTRLRELLDDPAAETATDESSLLVSRGGRLAWVEGDERGFKLTVPADLSRLSALLQEGELFCPG